MLKINIHILKSFSLFCEIRAAKEERGYYFLSSQSLCSRQEAKHFLVWRDFHCCLLHNCLYQQLSHQTVPVCLDQPLRSIVCQPEMSCDLFSPRFLFVSGYSSFLCEKPSLNPWHFSQCLASQPHSQLPFIPQRLSRLFTSMWWLTSLSERINN